MSGRTITLRFEWLDVTADSPRWVQSFSYDERESWEPSWVMTPTRSS
ncbi:hypothetical protein [Kitasatospora sp. NPDC058218]